MLGLSRFHRLVRGPLILKNPVLVHGYTSGHPPVAPLVHSLTATSSPKDLDAACEWTENFRFFALKREDVSLSFARSSGPGGQVSPVPNDHWPVLTLKYHTRM